MLVEGEGGKQAGSNVSYRVLGIASGEVLSDIFSTYDAALHTAREIEAHESQPEVVIQKLVGGEWVACGL